MYKLAQTFAPVFICVILNTQIFYPCVTFVASGTLPPLICFRDYGVYGLVTGHRKVRLFARLMAWKPFTSAFLGVSGVSY